MKRKTILILILAMLLSSVAYGFDYSRVENLGLMGQGTTNWDSRITRAELATVAVRLNNMEHLAKSPTENIYKDVEGWATGYINLSSSLGLMKGTSKNTFNPNSNVTYIELLTVVMRALGYEDKIDFTVFPNEYYQKAVEIGLANIYISPEKVITRGVVAETLDKGLDLKLKDNDVLLVSKFSKFPSTIKPNIPEEIKEDGEVTISNMKFVTSISAIFSGTVEGRTDFSGYEIILSSGNNNFSEKFTLERDGQFSITNFKIDTLTKLSGYKFKIIDKTGKNVYEEDLS